MPLLSSPSSQRVWIEMDYEKYDKEYQEQSPSSQRVWIEIERLDLNQPYPMSPSSQRVWIEITNDYDRLVKDSKVALFTEGVD